MTPGVASIVVHAPDGRTWTVDLQGDRLTVGRATSSSHPDLALEPDPQRWVGRLHCSVESYEGTWWLCDNGTVNGTLLWRDGVKERVIGRMPLQDSDTIGILGDLTDGQLLYWQLTFVDPHHTQPVPVNLADRFASAGCVCLEYDWVQARVYRHQDGVPTEITGLRPQAHQLIRYMADVSRKNGGVPVACSYAELIRALWGEQEEWEPNRAYTEQDLRYVVSNVRRHIEPDPPTPASWKQCEVSATDWSSAPAQQMTEPVHDLLPDQRRARARQTTCAAPEGSIPGLNAYPHCDEDERCPHRSD